MSLTAHAADDGALLARLLEGDLNVCRFNLPSIRFGWDFLLLWMAALGGLSALAALLLHKLEYLFREAPTNLKFLRQTYRELTILGFMSFVLIMVRDFASGLSKNDFQLIELAHLWIFSVGISFVSMGATVAAVLKWSKVRWDNAFAFGLQAIERKHESLEEDDAPSGPRRWREERYLMHKVRLWVMRKHFLRRNHLPASFEFSKYLRRSLTRVVLKEMEIDWETWAALGVVFLVGFIWASADDDGSGGSLLDVRQAERTLFTVSAWLLLCGLVVYAAVEVCTLRFLRVAGAPRPWRFLSLLEHAKNLHVEEGEDILDPSGRLTTDEVRLDAIFHECRNNDYLKSSEYTARHRVFDMIDVSTYLEAGVWPLSRSYLVAFVFRVLILAQSYSLGLTVVLLAQYQSAAISSTGILLVLGVFLSHILQIGFLFPRLLRNYALLRTVTTVDAAALDGIEECFMYQQDANESIYVLASILHTAYRAEATRQPETADAQPLLPPMSQVFAYLDPEGKGAVRASELQQRLELRPFRHFLRTRRIHMVLRALNCVNGMTPDRVVFLVNGMRRLEVSEHTEHARFRACFRGLAVTCHRCGRRVMALDMAGHPRTCEGATEEETQRRKSVFAAAARVRSTSRGSSFTGKTSNSTSQSAVGPVLSGSDAPESAADSEPSEFDDNSSVFRASVARDARFGLLRPFVLRDSDVP